MIPNRAPEAKRQCLTMLCYQQPAMVPRTPSNADQRKLVAKCSEVAANVRTSPAKCSELPKKIGRPKGPVKVKCADPRKQMGLTLSAGHDKRIRAEVTELFKHGPLTVAMIQKARKMTEYNSAGRKVFDWRARGLIQEVEGPAVVIGTNGQRCKWWDLAQRREAA